MVTDMAKTDIQLLGRVKMRFQVTWHLRLTVPVGPPAWCSALSIPNVLFQVAATMGQPW